MRNILYILFLFLVAQFIGIFAGHILSSDSAGNPYIQDLYINHAGGESIFSLIGIFLMVLLGTFLLLLLIKYYKGNLLFLLMEFGLISVPSSIIFYSFSRLYFPYLESMGIGIFLGVVLGLIKIFYGIFRNVSAIFASAAVGALFGLSFSPLFVLVFIVLLALYDYIAVFKTKHMVTLAKTVMKKNIALTISSKVKVPKVGIKRIDLGTGDLIVPIMLEVSFLPNLGASSLVLIGSSLAVFLLFYLSRKRKVILPALPPIIAGILVFILFGYLFGIV